MVSLHIFEVKNSISSSFNLRQMYYPYAMWKSHIKKPVRNIFLTHSNNYFDFYEIDFFQYIKSLETGLQIKIDYLNQVNIYNQIALELNYLNL